MHEKHIIDVPPGKDIHVLAQRCLKAEMDRDLSKNSMKELQRYLNEFTVHCSNHGIHSANELTPNFLKCYADQRCEGAGPNLKKAVVWSLRKFGKHIALLQVVKDDPARNLRHPRFHPRSELPEYLSESQLRRLLQHSARSRRQRDFAIISLMATTGLRANEIITIKRGDVHLKQHCIDAHVKGGWIKKTPLSNSMAAILADYLATRNDDCPALFVNTRYRPITVSWVQRMVKTAGKEAGLSLSLTCNHLRHTFATHAADQHGKIITKALMGHQRLATTEIYTHLSPRYFKSLMNLHPYQRITEKGVTNERQ